MIERVIIAYTDGSAVVNGKDAGKSGFGAYFPDLFGKKKAYSLGYKQGKTGQMEVTALLYAIKAIPKERTTPTRLIVYSDSEYVVKSFTEHRLKKWIANDWQNSSGTVANLELWKQIVGELHRRRFSLTLEMRHIKSHQVDKEKDPEKKKELMKNPHIIGNMMADKLADYKRHKNLI